MKANPGTTFPALSNDFVEIKNLINLGSHLNLESSGKKFNFRPLYFIATSWSHSSFLRFSKNQDNWLLLWFWNFTFQWWPTLKGELFSSSYSNTRIATVLFLWNSYADRQRGSPSTCRLSTVEPACRQPPLHCLVSFSRFNYFGAEAGRQPASQENRPAGGPSIRRGLEKEYSNKASGERSWLLSSLSHSHRRSNFSVPCTHIRTLAFGSAPPPNAHAQPSVWASRDATPLHERRETVKSVAARLRLEPTSVRTLRFLRNTLAYFYEFAVGFSDVHLSCFIDVFTWSSPRLCISLVNPPPWDCEILPCNKK